VVLGDLRHQLPSYQSYYNATRTHLSLNKDAPSRRAFEASGRILALPVSGGLHHQYRRSTTRTGAGSEAGEIPTVDRIYIRTRAHQEQRS
jgi:hypothetical protein